MKQTVNQEKIGLALVAWVNLLYDTDFFQSYILKDCI